MRPPAPGIESRRRRGGGRGDADADADAVAGATPETSKRAPRARGCSRGVGSPPKPPAQAAPAAAAAAPVVKAEPLDDGDAALHVGPASSGRCEMEGLDALMDGMGAMGAMGAMEMAGAGARQPHPNRSLTVPRTARPTCTLVPSCTVLHYLAPSGASR